MLKFTSICSNLAMSPDLTLVFVDMPPHEAAATEVESLKVVPAEVRLAMVGREQLLLLIAS